LFNDFWQVKEKTEIFKNMRERKLFIDLMQKAYRTELRR
jgi:hypothetical protein